MNPASPLPITRYRFTAAALQPLPLPHSAGSLLRGQFGAALRHAACMTRQPTCGGCPLLQTCPYTRIFEAPPPAKGAHALQDFSQIPKPYVVEPPPFGARTLQAGEPLVFHMVLVGHAIEQLALILFAWQRALAHGLTRQRIPAELLQVDCLDGAGAALPVWSREQPVLAGHAAELPTPAAPPDLRNLTLNIHTPLRLQHQGRPLGVAELTPRALVAAVARRAALLMELHGRQTGWGDAAKEAARLAQTALTDQRDLQWLDWTRYSSRQHQEMTLGGVLGQWTLNGDADTLKRLWPWLWLGQWLHVGKNATMGMGAYTLAGG